MKYQIKIDQQTYSVEIKDLHERPIQVTVDGVAFAAWPENGSILPVEAQGVAPASSSTPLIASTLSPAPAMSAASSASGNLLKAPIPGVIVAVLVKPGDEVAFGSELITIEAMKMRNAIRASRPGKIAQVLVAPGQTVNHGDPLLEFEA
jgi:glutaconyl-CoA/methylmalonyl-CoA decarboxylase subunit gamma